MFSLLKRFENEGGLVKGRSKTLLLCYKDIVNNNNMLGFFLIPVIK